MVIVGQKIAPGFADRYLADNGFQSQQTSELQDSEAPYNLWSPVDDSHDHGAHGRIDTRAGNSSPVLAISKHAPRLRYLVGAGVGVVAGLLLFSHLAGLRRG